MMAAPNRLIAPLSAGRVAAVETLVLPALAVGAGIWLNPLDPLWSRAAFPWPWLAPLLLALRYGPFAGLFGAVFYVLAWTGLQRLDMVQGEFPKLYFLGGLMVVMISGEFASIWRARVRRAEAMQIYLDQRLESLTHQHYLLRLSHDRLEQDLISRPVSMRDALGTMHTLVERAFGSAPLPGGEALLRLLAQYCQLEQAGLYLLGDKGLDPAPAAALGQPFELERDDALVRFALDSGRLCHVQNPESGGGSAYLVAAPLRSGDGRAYGILVVRHLPFFALHEEMLQTVNLLLGYYSDGLDARGVVAPVLRAIPACPVDFAFELQRLWRIRTDSGVRSAIVTLGFAPRPGYDDLPLQVKRQQRSLDATWLLGDGRRNLLVTLLPLSSAAGAEGYLGRVESWLERQTGKGFAGNDIATHVFLLDELEPAVLLRQILDACHVAPEARTVSSDA